MQWCHAPPMNSHIVQKSPNAIAWLSKPSVCDQCFQPIPLLYLFYAPNNLGCWPSLSNTPWPFSFSVSIYALPGTHPFIGNFSKKALPCNITKNKYRKQSGKNHHFVTMKIKLTQAKIIN